MHATDKPILHMYDMQRHVLHMHEQAMSTCTMHEQAMSTCTMHEQATSSTYTCRFSLTHDAKSLIELSMQESSIATS